MSDGCASSRWRGRSPRGCGENSKHLRITPVGASVSYGLSEML